MTDHGYLTLPRLEARPKKVVLADNYRRVATLTAAAESDLLDLIEMVTEGRRVPARFYRRGVDTTPDRLLQQEGIMHLHLVRPGSDELVYLVQYDDTVLILETNTHDHFHSRPPGGVLRSLHATHIDRLGRVALTRAGAKREARVIGFEALRRSARSRKPSEDD